MQAYDYITYTRLAIPKTLTMVTMVLMTALLGAQGVIIYTDWLVSG